MEALQVYNPGVLEVYSGCMKSGKTARTISRLRRVALFPEIGYVLFKPSIDDRFKTPHVLSRDGTGLDSIVIPVSNPEKILDYVTADHKVVGISEVQFFPELIIPVVRALLDENKNVICEGLNTDFRGEPFGSVPYLLGIADHAEILTAVCDCISEQGGKQMRCTNPATRTQRIIDKQPAHYNSPIILVGDRDFYESRCIAHHVVPGKPKTNYRELIASAKTNS
jgi:thymidine kinase